MNTNWGVPTNLPKLQLQIHSMHFSTISEKVLSVTWAEVVCLWVGGWGCVWKTLGYLRFILGSVQSHTLIHFFVCDSYQLGCKPWPPLHPLQMRHQISQLKTKKFENTKTEEEWGWRNWWIEMMLFCNLIWCVSFWPEDSCSLTHAMQLNEERTNLGGGVWFAFKELYTYWETKAVWSNSFKII